MPKASILASERLDRYRHVVPDWEAFVEASAAPLPLCLWTNALRTDARSVARHLEREGIPADPVDWRPGTFKGPPSDRAGRCVPFVAGLYHIQEEVSLLPVHLLAPRPDERVIDLCSAPGNKTAQMGVAMRNTGTIVANDRDAMRTRATRGVLDRLGIINTTITTADASNLPDSVGRFDRVLADVPCTCEGTTRKHVDALLQSGRDVSLGLQRRQTAILRKAVQLCAPGGLIVYATCTYAPEENEMVVDAVRREASEHVEILPARVDGFTASPGLTEWNGVELDPALARCMRVWPHQNDTGGFFVALLRKPVDGTAASGADSVEERGSEPSGDVESAATDDGAGGVAVDEYALSATDRKRWIDLLFDRFRIEKDAFEDMRLHIPNNKYVAAVSGGHRTIARPDPVSIGMPLIRIGLRYPKLTTAGARLLGRLARRNVVSVDADQAAAYMNRRDFFPTRDQLDAITDTGYVLIEREGAMLGVGLYLGEAGRVRSMFPKVLSQAVPD